MTVSILIEVYNEQKHIEECVKSARLLTHKALVIDMLSTDKTVEKAKNSGAEVIQFGKHPLYVEPAREFGIRQVKTDWAMILDADERMTPELAEEIKSAIQSDKHTYYKIPRKNIFGGKKWLKHGGWWPDHQMRLINIKHFKKWPADIHSTPHIDGSLGYLKEPFLHYFHGNLKTMVDKTLVFENIEANLLFEASRSASTPIFFRKFFGELGRRLLKKKGYLDGEVGIIECIYQAFSKTITYLFLYEKTIRRSV